MKMKFTAALMGAMGLLSFVSVQSSFAAISGYSCESATTCTLSNWNSTTLQGTGDTVVVTLNDGANTMTFTYIDGSGSPDPDLKNLKTIGWNVVDSGSATGYTSTGSNNLDGFGLFTNTYSKDSVSGVQSPPSVTFSNISATTLIGANFAVHVQYQDNCSGWVGNGSNGQDGSSGTGCGGTSVPEPASLMLLGAGLAGIGIWRRKLA